MDEMYDLKNQIEFSNTGKHESNLVFSLREQIKLLKEENEIKTFINKQNQNNLPNMGTNFFSQQRKLQSIDKNIAEEIPMDNFFSESKHLTRVCSKEQLNENPESNISSNYDVDFKMEPTRERITERKHDVNNTSKASNDGQQASNDANNNNSHNKSKDYVSNTNTSSKETYKNKNNHKDKKNEKLSKEQKRNQETAGQNTSDRKRKPSIFIKGDSLVKN